MQTKHLVLALVLVLTLFMVGCSSQIDAPTEFRPFVGEPTDFSIHVPQLATNAEGVRVISNPNCKGVSVSQEQVVDSFQKTITAKVTLLYYVAGPLTNCLILETTDPPEILGTTIFPRRQAMFKETESISFPGQVSFNVDYPITFPITVNDEDREHNLGIQLSTKAPAILAGGKDIREYMWSRKTSRDSTELRPDTTLRIVDTGDTTRGVDIKAELLVQVNDVWYPLDERVISTIGS